MSLEFCESCGQKTRETHGERLRQLCDVVRLWVEFFEADGCEPTHEHHADLNWLQDGVAELQGYVDRYKRWLIGRDSLL